MCDADFAVPSKSIEGLKKALQDLVVTILEVRNGEIIIPEYSHDALGRIILEFGMKKAYVSAKKLKSVLYSKANEGRVVATPTGELFQIIVPYQLLLDNAIA